MFMAEFCVSECLRFAKQRRPHRGQHVACLFKRFTAGDFTGSACHTLPNRSHTAASQLSSCSARVAREETSRCAHSVPDSKRANRTRLDNHDRTRLPSGNAPTTTSLRRTAERRATR